MIAYFILGLCIFVGAVLIVRWFAGADPKQVLRVLKWVLALVAIGLLLTFLFAGRHALALILLPALLPLLARLRMAMQRLRTMRGPKGGQTSEVTTRFFRMTLDHDSGEMDGVVLVGEHRGERLSELGPEALIALWRECRAEDEQSASVLEAYLDRTQGDAWREAAGASGGEGAGGSNRAQGQPPMTREEALQVLGLEPGASKDEIRAAHRRLMRHAHPDHGGSNYLAAKINQAKDLLIDA